MASAVNAAIIRSNKYLAWPNMWAGTDAPVVPELVGLIEPATAAEEVEALLSDPGKLKAMRARLLALRGGRLAPGQQDQQKSVDALAGGAGVGGGQATGQKGGAAGSVAEEAERQLRIIAARPAAA